MLLTDKTAVISGAASARGIGRATARLFASQGARVAILDLDAAAAKGAAEELGPDHIGLGCDVGDLASCRQAAEQAIAAFGKIDIPGDKLTPEMKADIIKGIPLSRLGDAKDVANIYLFLAPDLSAYVTGAVIDVNGGMLIH